MISLMATLKKIFFCNSFHSIFHIISPYYTNNQHSFIEKDIGKVQILKE